MKITLALLSMAMVSYVLADILRRLAKKQGEKKVKHPRRQKVMCERAELKSVRRHNAR
jgi:hypothetical protein